MSTPLFVTFLGGDGGSWTVERFDVVRGETMPEVGAIEIVEGTIAHIVGEGPGHCAASRVTSGM